jgi:hypothetical protein
MKNFIKEYKVNKLIKLKMRPIPIEEFNMERDYQLIVINHGIGINFIVLLILLLWVIIITCQYFPKRVLLRSTEEI